MACYRVHVHVYTPFLQARMMCCTIQNKTQLRMQAQYTLIGCGYLGITPVVVITTPCVMLCTPFQHVQTIPVCLST